MADKYNESPIALREGKVFIEGVEVYNHVKFELKFTPKVWTGSALEIASAVFSSACDIAVIAVHS